MTAITRDDSLGRQRRGELHPEPAGRARRGPRVRHRGRGALDHAHPPGSRRSGSPTPRRSSTELDREGFVLVPHVSAVADFDLIQEDAAVDQQYIDEMTELLARRHRRVAARSCSAAARSATARARTDKLAPLLNAKPARYPARRQHRRVGRRARRHHRDVRRRPRPRAATRAGRSTTCGAPTTPPPQDFPLAVCDARTLAPGDEVTVTAITDGAQSGEIRPRHHRVPLQPRPSLALLPRHDARRGPRVQGARHRHAARRSGAAHRVHRPDLPAGHVPTRASVEMRGLALFD